MTLKNWLDKQGFPHGMECVGEARLQELWDAAQIEHLELQLAAEREACAKICEMLLLQLSADKYSSIEERHLISVVESGCRGAFADAIRRKP